MRAGAAPAGAATDKVRSHREVCAGGETFIKSSAWPFFHLKSLKSFIRQIERPSTVRVQVHLGIWKLALADRKRVAALCIWAVDNPSQPIFQIQMPVVARCF